MRTPQNWHLALGALLALALWSAEVRTLEISSQPESAEVTVNGKQVGLTPLVLQIDVAGHMVEVRKKGHHPHFERIQPGAIDPYQVEVRLEPFRPPVRLTSSPPGASILMAGKPLGTTPCVVPLPLGTKEVTFSLAGHQSRTITLQVPDERPVGLHCLLESLLGKLRVDTTPQGASIYINGQYRGNSPLVLTDLMAGRHEVQGRLAGHENVSNSVTLLKDQEVRVPLPAFQAKPGALRVETTPTGVDVYGNDELLGTTPFERKNLAPGILILRLTKTGFDDVHQNASIGPGKTTKIITNMESVLGGFSLATEPPGCQIYVGAKNLGTTRQQGTRLVSKITDFADLAEGPHLVEVRKAGYAPIRKKVLVFRGELTQLGTLRLTKLWIPDHELHKANGEVIQGVLVSKAANGSIEFSPMKSVTILYDEDEYIKLRPLKTVAP